MHLLYKMKEKDFLQQSSKTVVLEEDKWMDSMEKIIKRDFFPDIDVMTSQIRLIEAIQSKDPQLIEMAQRKVAQTQSNVIISGERKVPLDEFLSKYTSEDNASFEVILQKMKDTHRETWRKYFHESKSRGSGTDVKLLTNGSVEMKLIGESKPINKNALFYPPESGSQRETVVSNLPSKKIVYENIKYVEPKMETNFAKKKDDLWTQDVLHDEIVEGSETPIINGYKMIKQPSIKELEDESSRLMSWGSVMDSNVLDGPSFKIPDTPKREQIAMDLLDKTKRKSTTPSVNVNKSPLNRLTSPVQKLLENRKRTNDGYASSLRSSYSPSVTPNNTPKTTDPTTPTLKKVKTESITDGLLKL
jgi:protein DGCR14